MKAIPLEPVAAPTVPTTEPATSGSTQPWTIAFAGIWLFSKIDSSQRGREEVASFDAQYVRSETGIGASGASGH